MSVDNKLYKYKKIKSAKDIEFIYDILKKHRLYFPRYSELNDPLEGTVFAISPSEGYMGMTIPMNAGCEASIVTQFKEKYRILSFSANPFSPQMWAHYAGNFEGLCLCYNARDLLNRIQPIRYVDNQKPIECDDEDLERTIFENFFLKQIGWKYEEEYRIVEKTDTEFFYYKQDILQAIIIGEKLSMELTDVLRNIIPERVQIFRTRVETGKFRIVIEPLDLKIEYDGGKPYKIASKRALESRIDDMKYPCISWGYNKN